MNYVGTAGDVAMDFIRSIDEKRPEDSVFYKNGMSLWENNIRPKVDSRLRAKIDNCILRFKNNRKNDIYKREDLYTAAEFLKTYYITKLENRK